MERCVHCGMPSTAVGLVRFRAAHVGDTLGRRNKGEVVMRFSFVVIAAALACVPYFAAAQDQPSPIQDQAASQDQRKDQEKSPGLIEDQTGSQPQSVPKTLPKSQDRVEDQSGPAEADAPPKTPSRFSFVRIKDNFLRLDRETGQVAYCSTHASGFACEAVPEERAALEKEIGRLQNEVAKLRSEVASLREPVHPIPPALVPPAPDAGKDGDVSIKLPSTEDIARARAFFEIAWRRLVEMIGNIQKDMMYKG